MSRLETPDLPIVLAREIDEDELAGFIQHVYVGGGFTAPEVAASALTGAAIRARGDLWIARAGDGRLVGTVIVVEPTGPARRLAASDEAEMHLLAVAPEQRGRGLGSRLVQAAIEASRAGGFARLVLWTQPSMVAAQRLYVAHGFVRAPARDSALQPPPGRTFHVYQKEL